MKNKIVSYLSNGFLVLGFGVGLYVLADTFIMRSRLPEGACPITNNRPLIYSAIVFCCMSFVLSFFETKDNKID